MAYFAHINNGIIDSVIVIDETTLVANNGWVIDGEHKPLNEWKQTSYNTRLGEYKLGKTQAERDVNKLKGTANDIAARERKNFAGKGFAYDPVDDIFIVPKNYPSWKLDKLTGSYQAPKAKPEILETEFARWDEESLSWIIEPKLNQ